MQMAEVQDELLAQAEPAAICRICQNALNRAPYVDADHVRNPSPMFADICLGCWIFTVQMELFLVRATGTSPMGNWTEGWARAIVEAPKKFRDGP